MKSADEVGKDFNAYAKAWVEQQYGLEVEHGADGLVRDLESAEVQLPGDEWGDSQVLRDRYAALVTRLALPESVNVLEIGAGGGRSTAALLEVLGERAGSYHVIDVADAFVDTLRGRVSRPLDIHIVSDVDVSMLDDSSVDLVLAQSSWSHINLYDQYRYLRDVRRVLKRGAPVVVIGLFMVGASEGWTWNRFRRRVYQIDHGISGVYHEFTSIGLVTEMLARLGYEDVVLFANGFTARRGRLVGDDHIASLPDGINYQFEASIDDWIATGLAIPSRLPPSRATAGPPEQQPEQGSAGSSLDRFRHGIAWRAGKLRWRMR